MWDIDLLDADLGLLDTDISSKHFVCLQGVLKTSSRDVFKKWLQDVFNTFFEGVLKIWLQDVFSIKFFIFQDVLKTSWRYSRHFAKCLQGRQKNLMLKTTIDIFKTCLVDQQTFAGKVPNQKMKIYHKVLIIYFSHKATTELLINDL